MKYWRLIFLKFNYILKKKIMETKYNTMQNELPLYNQQLTSSRNNSRIVDCSEPFFVIFGITGFIGLIINIINSHNFDIAVASFCFLSSTIGVWRVRKLGIAKKIMDSINDLKLENMRLEETEKQLERENLLLKNTNDELKETSTQLSNDIDKFKILTNIMDTNNKTSEEIQEDLLNTVERYEKENKRYEINNKISLFYTADQNRDGFLSKEEIYIIKKILKDEYNIDYILDTNQDGEITRKEFLEKILS
jgi:hypothetical protein